jgi:hypothetical protein
MEMEPLMSSFRPLTALAVLFVIVSARPAAASQELRKELADLAAEIKKVLKGEGAEDGPVAVGEFTGPPNFPTTSGPGLAEMLSEELQKLGVTVKVRASYGIKGSYTPTELPASNADDARIGKKVLALKLTAELVDGLGKPVGNFNFNRAIRGEGPFLDVIPLGVHLDPAGTELERDKALRLAYAVPTPTIKGSVIRSSGASPYGIEILVGDKPRAAEDKDKTGLAYLSKPIERGETYAVRLINDADHDAAVQLRIDGLSLFTFSELRHTTGTRKGEPLYTVFLVPAKSSTIIPGWHVTNEKSDRFVVTEYAKSASANLKPSEKLGTISATFQAAWPEGAKPPADEPGKRRGPGTGDATGRGPRIEKKYVEVTRELGIIRDSVTVRYTK